MFQTMASRVAAALLLAILGTPLTLAATPKCRSALVQLKNYDTVSSVVSIWHHSVTHANLTCESLKHKNIDVFATHRLNASSTFLLTLFQTGFEPPLRGFIEGIARTPGSYSSCQPMPL